MFHKVSQTFEQILNVESIHKSKRVTRKLYIQSHPKLENGCCTNFFHGVSTTMYFSSL